MASIHSKEETESERLAGFATEDHQCDSDY